MTRYEFLQTLKVAMHGLPPETAERVLAEHERRFDDGAAQGRSEEDIARELGDPFSIADALRAPPAGFAAAPAAPASAPGAAPAAAAQQRGGVARAARICVSSLGLLLFNAFMVIPAMVYASLLMAFYVVAVACYFGGIVLTASSLSGVNEMSFRVPFEQVVVESGRVGDRVHVDIGDHGIHVGGADVGPAAEDEGEDEPPLTVRHHRDALIVADRSELRSLKAWHGIGIILGGILLLLLSALITKYTWIGMKRYVQMNISLLRTA